MTQVSKYPIRKDLEERMYQIFWETIAELEDEKEVEGFFLDFLTPTEKIMLAKRLAIAILLAKSWNYESIANVLKVSSSTIGNVATWLKRGGEGYKMAIDRIIKDEKWEEIFENFADKLKDFLDLEKPYWKFGPHNESGKAKPEI